MRTRAVRDILCSDQNTKMVNLQRERERPLCPDRNGNRGYPCPLLSRGSLTVEASFAAAAFFLALFALLYLFQILCEIHIVQMRLASAVWQYETLGTRFGTVEGLLGEHILIRWDEQKEICFVERVKKIPYLGGEFFGIALYQQMKIHSYQGQSMVSADQGRQDAYVYVAENGSVYHRNRDCAYLRPKIQELGYGEVGSQRNQSGGIYKHCQDCCKGVRLSDGTPVYITPYGDCCHVDAACPGLKRTVRKIRLSEAGNLPSCSKCGG